MVEVGGEEEHSTTPNHFLLINVREEVQKCPLVRFLNFFLQHFFVLEKQYIFVARNTDKQKEGSKSQPYCHLTVNHF